MNNDYAFDTSLFNRFEPKLARRVQELCEDVGFKGLSHIKLPWAFAKSFASKGAVYRNMRELQAIFALAKVEEKRNFHKRALQEYITSSNNFQQFQSRLRQIVQLAQYNKRFLNRVYYKELYRE